MGKIDEMIENLSDIGLDKLTEAVLRHDIEQLRPYVELGEYISENEDNVIDWPYLSSSKTQKIYADKIRELIQQIKEQQ